MKAQNGVKLMILEMLSRVLDGVNGLIGKEIPILALFESPDVGISLKLLIGTVNGQRAVVVTQVLLKLTPTKVVESVSITSNQVD